jgi:hypothetical protein
MALKITRVSLWAAEIGDQPGGLADKLAALTQARANLEFILARRAPEAPGRGVVFVAPLTSARQRRAARAAGFELLRRVGAVRLQGRDAPGLGARMTELVANTGVNLRGFAAGAARRRCVLYFVFDCGADANMAVRAIKGASKQ